MFHSHCSAIHTTMEWHRGQLRSTQEQTAFAGHKDERWLKRPAPVLSYTWLTCVLHESTPFVTYEDGRLLSQPAPVSIMRAVRRMAKSRELHSATGATPLLSHANTAQKSFHIPWSAQPEQRQRRLLRIVSYACAAPSLWYTKTGDDSQNWHRICDACAWWTAHGTAAFCTWADPLCDAQRQEVTPKTSICPGIHTAGRVAQGPTVFYAWAEPYARHTVRRMAEGAIVLLSTHTSRTLCDTRSRKNGVGGTTVLHTRAQPFFTTQMGESSQDQHPVGDAHRQKNGWEHDHIAKHGLPVIGDGILGQSTGNHVDLVGDADEDERSDDHVEHWVARQQHQHTVSVCCQPHMVLTDEQLQKRGATNQFLKQTPDKTAFTSLSHTAWKSS